MKKIDFNNLGGLPSPQDYRDISIGAVSPEPPIFPLSYKVDISKLPVWYQAKLGACVGHAIGKRKQRNELTENGVVFNFSARFLYALSKSKDGYAGEGTYPRTTMSVLKDFGICQEDTLPNDTNLSHADYIDMYKIPKEAFIQAEPFCIKSYASVPMTENGIKNGIMVGEGIAILMRVGDTWWKNKAGVSSWEAKDILPLRRPTDITSGHEVYLYGWDTINGRTVFYLLNSWSDKWGDKGTGYFYYDEWKDLLIEGWTSIDLPNNWLEEVHNLPPPNTFHHNFTTPILFGQKSGEVRNLQIALKIDGTFPAYIPETDYGYYGMITAKAVYDFQVKYKVATLSELNALGGKRVGLKTLAQLNLLFNN